MGTYYTWRAWRRSKRRGAGDTETALQRIHGGPGQRPWEVPGIPAGVLQGNADVKVTYTRHTSTLSLSGYHSTVETFEVNRERGGRRQIAAVEEEVD